MEYFKKIGHAKDSQNYWHHLRTGFDNAEGLKENMKLSLITGLKKGITFS
jgi:hypothetical protein